ncbi:MAG: T9SS type A sorting domain-containing protein [Bacteroidia bacterium]|nr:T9SS type A sorting domain-containing protein [Bacteroidia bacterium]
MTGILVPKRFLSFLVLALAFFALQSFSLKEGNSNEILRGVIIEVEEIFFSYEPEEDEHVWVAGNPATNGQWIKVIGDDVITDFTLIDDTGSVIADEKILSDKFKFKTDGLDAGIYYMQFLISGTWYSKTLVLE